MANCSLFSNHGNVLLVLAEDPEARLRDVAARVGITERAVQSIVRDLQSEGIVEVSRHGRRNRYRINARKSLRHPLTVNRTVGQLLGLMRESRSAPAPTKTSGDPAAPKTAPETDGPSTPQAPPPSGPMSVPELPPAPLPGAEPHAEPVQAERPAATAKPPSADAPADKRKAGRRSPDDQQGSLF